MSADVTKRTAEVTGPRNGQGNATADRAVQVLLLYDESRPTLSAAEVAGHLGMSRSTTYRYLQSLRAAGLLEEDPATASFRLGPRIFALARVARKGLGLSELATPTMRHLVAETGETVLLTCRSGSHVICVEREESAQHLRLSYERGQILPVHAGASAVILLAWVEPGELDKILAETALDRFTESTITEANVLRARLSEIRKLGYAVSFGERDPGVVGIAAPIWNEKGQVAAGLSVVIPSHRVSDGKLQDIITAVRAHADEISERLTLTHS
jgi:DNA-binding IclR family transcriptional regulator